MLDDGVAKPGQKQHTGVAKPGQKEDTAVAKPGENSDATKPFEWLHVPVTALFYNIGSKSTQVQNENCATSGLTT